MESGINLFSLMFILSCLGALAFPFSREAGGPVDYKLLTECERLLQKNCIEKYSDEKTLFGISEGKCEIEKLYNCINEEVKKQECRVKDVGTVAYIKDFTKRLNNIFITKKKCMNPQARKEVLELFKPPEFGYNNTTAHIQEPPHFETSGGSAHWGSDDTEPGETDYGSDEVSGHGEDG